MIWIYNFLLTALSPIWAPLVFFKAKKRRESPNWRERMGEIQVPLDRARKVLWLHAVSVGEVVAALSVLKELRAQDPTAQIVLSVTTSTGHQTARDRVMKAGLADHLIYFPMDVARFMWVATWRVRPHAVALFETELWMNFLHFSKQVGATTLLVNGRISDRSFKRSRAFKFFFNPMLALLDRALMQTQQDADRIKALGAAQPEVVGNTKFDEEPAGAEARAHWRDILQAKEDDLVLVIGSTRGAEEEALVLEALSQLDRERLRIVHAPRHVEDAGALAERASQLGPVSRRSLGESGPYLLLDTYGELSSVYAAADIAVIGGGFAPLGGQNLIQPLACGVPVVHGPNMHNFREAAALAQASGASRVATNASELAQILRELMANADLRQQMGRKGQECVAAHRGASARYAKDILASAQAPFEAEQAQRAKKKP